MTKISSVLFIDSSATGRFIFNDGTKQMSIIYRNGLWWSVPLGSQEITDNAISSRTIDELVIQLQS